MRFDTSRIGRRGTIARLILPGLIAALCAASPAQDRRGSGAPGEGRPAGRGGNSYANPTAAIAADIALTRQARDRGEWTALLDAAAPDAVLMAPQPTWAQIWLKGRPDPLQPALRRPDEVWASCDGALAVTRGQWSRGEETGWFATVWQRQIDGRWKWVFTDSGLSAAPRAEGDFLLAHVADCPERQRAESAGARGAGPGQPQKPKSVRVKDLPPLDPAVRAGTSPDGSLRWEARVTGAQSRSLTITWRKDGAEAAALSETAQGGPAFR